MEGHGLQVAERGYLGFPRLPVQLLGVDVIVVDRSAGRELGLEERGPNTRRHRNVSGSRRERMCMHFREFVGLLSAYTGDILLAG